MHDDIGPSIYIYDVFYYIWLFGFDVEILIEVPNFCKV